MALNGVYKKYFQKSKVFLYPLLDIPRGTKALPIETYISWQEKYAPDDTKFICVYNTIVDPEYILFEQQHLLRHNRLVEHITIDTSTSILIFDFSDLQDDWNKIINGKYSEIQDHLKQKILKYFNNNSKNYEYIKSYLFPDFYMNQYAILLDVPTELLLSVGELCSKPDLEKENLTISIPNLENIEILD